MKIATYTGRTDGEESSSLTVGDAVLPLGQPRTVTDPQVKDIEAVSEEFAVTIEAATGKGEKPLRADGSDDHDEAPDAGGPED